MGAGAVSRTLLGVIEERGRPEFVRSDNGSEFIARSLMKMLAGRGIACRHIDPGSPWQNGKTERFNGTLRSECTQDGDVCSPGSSAGDLPAVHAEVQPRAAAFEPGLPDPGGVRAATLPAGCRLPGHKRQRPSPAAGRQYRIVVMDIHVFEVYTSRWSQEWGLDIATSVVNRDLDTAISTMGPCNAGGFNAKRAIL